MKKITIILTFAQAKMLLENLPEGHQITLSVTKLKKPAVAGFFVMFIQISFAIVFNIFLYLTIAIIWLITIPKIKGEQAKTFPD